MNRKVKKQLNEIFAFFGLTSKEKRDAMTNEDWNKIKAEYLTKFGVELETDLQSPEDDPSTVEGSAAISPDLQQQILAALETAAAAAGTPPPAQAPATVEDVAQSFVSAINAATQTIQTLSAQPEPVTPVQVVQTDGRMSPKTLAIMLGHTAHTQTHLFGIENDYFRRGNWWNDLVATGRGRDSYRDQDATDFRAAFNNYAKDFSQRCADLHASRQIGLLDYQKMIRGESFVDYSRMNIKLGEYIVRRMDTIIAYLRTLNSVAPFFPVVSNVQNKMTAPTAFFEELSQSYKAGHIFKGAVNFDGEIYHVKDIMFKFFFEDPKQLEREYIGYMNREGSNPMKWTLFEWCIVHFGTLLFNEQQRRRVIGAYVPRQGDFPQPAMRAADGALRAIQRVEEELKVLPFKDMRLYDRSTILDYIETFWENVNSILPNMAGYRLYANLKHQTWYLQAFRAKYGQDGDFNGTRNFIQDLTPLSILWVPNMDMNDYKVWITRPGNVENYEDKPNEMYSLYFQQDLEQLIMASWWKEGSGVLAPGVQFLTLTDLEKSGRKLQWVFTNYPVIALDPDATTIDGSIAYEFETGANTAATVITDITDPSVERVYKIICGSLTNATTVSKTGKFAGIASAWTPVAVGDWLKVYAELAQVTRTVNGVTRTFVEPTGNFLELERKVS